MDIFFKQMVDLVAGLPECAAGVQRLFSDGAIPIPSELVKGDRPTRLEMAGIAVREGDKLTFASELVADFVKRYYEPRQLADTLARQGNWEAAFGLYEQLKSEERLRPESSAERADLRAALQSFQSFLRSAAADSPDRVAACFVRGVKNLLGFSEVTFWEHVQNVWRLDRQTWGDQLAPNDTALLRGCLPATPSSSESLYPSQDNSERAVVFNLPSLEDGVPRLAALSNLVSATGISPRRRQLAGQLAEEFYQALQQAQQIRSHAHTPGITRATHQNRPRHH